MDLERLLRFKQEIILKMLASKKRDKSGSLSGTKFTNVVTQPKRTESNPASVTVYSTLVSWMLSIAKPILTHLRNLDSGRHMNKGLSGISGVPANDRLLAWRKTLWKILLSNAGARLHQGMHLLNVLNMVVIANVTVLSSKWSNKERITKISMTALKQSIPQTTWMEPEALSVAKRTSKWSMSLQAKTRSAGVTRTRKQWTLKQSTASRNTGELKESNWNSKRWSLSQEEEYQSRKLVVLPQ